MCGRREQPRAPYAPRAPKRVVAGAMRGFAVHFSAHKVRDPLPPDASAHMRRCCSYVEGAKCSTSTRTRARTAKLGVADFELVVHRASSVAGGGGVRRARVDWGRVHVGGGAAALGGGGACTDVMRSEFAGG